MGWFSSSEKASLPIEKPEEPEKPDNALLAEALSDPAPMPPSAEDLEEARLQKEREAAQAEYLAFSHTQRLGIAPGPRLVLTGVTAGGYGFLSGFYSGFKMGGLRYLAQNAHRLPRTKGGWYFYHKRKNYVVLKEAIMTGTRTGSKYTAAAVAYFGIEAYLDHVRGQIDFLSTAVAAVGLGAGYSFYSRLSKVQTLNTMRSFLGFGIAAGLVQDGLRYMRGNEVWYLNWISRKVSSEPALES